jgi:hypothetical protein
MSGPVTSVARVEDVQIFLKEPVYLYLYLHLHLHLRLRLSMSISIFISTSIYLYVYLYLYLYTKFGIVPPTDKNIGVWGWDIRMVNVIHHEPSTDQEGEDRVTFPQSCPDLYWGCVGSSWTLDTDCKFRKPNFALQTVSTATKWNSTFDFICSSWWTLGCGIYCGKWVTAFRKYLLLPSSR